MSGGFSSLILSQHVNTGGFCWLAINFVLHICLKTITALLPLLVELRFASIPPVVIINIDNSYMYVHPTQSIYAFGHL